MTTQTDAFAEKRPTTAMGMVHGTLEIAAMIVEEWLTAYQVQLSVQLTFGELYSESTITARIRDLRKAQYGGHRIDCRKRKGSRAWEYLLRGRVKFDRPKPSTDEEIREQLEDGRDY